MNQWLKLKNTGIIVIILITVILIVLGIRFIHYQNIQYQQSNKETVTVVEEEIETKIPEDKQIEKEPIKPQEQEEYKEKGFEEDTLMIF